MGWSASWSSQGLSNIQILGYENVHYENTWMDVFCKRRFDQVKVDQYVLFGPKLSDQVSAGKSASWSSQEELINELIKPRITKRADQV